MNFSVNSILEIIVSEIRGWHERGLSGHADGEIWIRPLNEHREDLYEVVRDLAGINAEMWHEQDKMRSADDAAVVKAFRRITPLNQRRNDLIEEIDEIVAEASPGSPDLADRLLARISQTIAAHDMQDGDDLLAAVGELTRTNSRIWDIEDGARTDDDALAARLIQEGNALNVHRSRLVERIDEIVLDRAEKGEEKWRP